MQINNKTGIIGLITILLAFGGTVVLTPEQVDYAYVCVNGQEPPSWGIFYGGISSTGLTAYPFKENRTQPTKCNGGVWVKLTKYANEMGKDSLELIKELNKENYGVVSEGGFEKWVCEPNQKPCVKVG